MPRTHDRKGRNPIGKLGRAVGGGISKVGRSILPKGKKGAAYATATAGGSAENHHYIGGYLHKISDGKWSKRVWHTRWFVLDLERGVLSYYKANPSSSINSPHGSVAFYDDLDLHLHVGDDARTSHHHAQHPVVHKPHPWFRGCMDLNQINVSLLFEKQFAQNAPNQYFFQVSNLNIGESESKRGSQYKVYIYPNVSNQVGFILDSSALIRKRSLCSGRMRSLTSSTASTRPAKPSPVRCRTFSFLRNLTINLQNPTCRFSKFTDSVSKNRRSTKRPR